MSAAFAHQFNRKANYLEAAAESVDPETKTVTCYGISCDEFCEIKEFTVEYDRLVVAVGARVNTFGIPGVEEHCSFLKQIDDARQIRRKIVNLFEQANYPGQSEKQIQKLLTFAVIGAGPTGVEFAGELRDFIEEDGPKYYPHLLKHVRIKIIEATPVVLRPFDKTLQEAAIDALTRPAAQKRPDVAQLFPREFTELYLDRKVEEVTENVIRLADGTDIPYGLAVWAGGIGPLPITLDIINAIGGLQKKAQRVARGKIAVDPWLRAVDGEGRIFAIGDCVCTQNSVSSWHQQRQSS
jgi:NADH dehydrogenase FAD-containing subunit